MFDERPYGHMVHEYYVQRLREISRRRAEARARVRTRKQLMQLRQEVRRKLRRCFGTFPRRTPMNPRITGTINRKHCTIEKVTYYSRPNFPVTANLYIPKRGKGPFPGVLGVCGHMQDGKAAKLYQAFCQNLGRMGYVVLIYDPISQGERKQYPRKEGAIHPRGCTAEHTMGGNQMHLFGDFFGTWRVWDGIRSLDYLLSRPEVDPTRIGVTGNSGGGTLTTYLTALDDRFSMAAPGCYVNRQIRNLENERPQDSEQYPPGMLAAGLDIADFFVAAIPRPTLLLGQKNDYFDPRGLEETCQELRRLYGILGKEKDVALFIGPRDHGYHKENREAMYRFFNKHASVRVRPREPEGQRSEAVRTLCVTPKGQVDGRGARRVFDFTREKALELAKRRKPLRGKALVRAITKHLRLPHRGEPPYYRALRLGKHFADLPQGTTGFAVETEHGIQALVYAFTRKQYLLHFPPGREATVYVPHLSAKQEAIEGKTPEVPLLFAVETRGTGQLTPETCQTNDFFATHGSDYMYASYGVMLDEPYCGRRVHDLLSVLDLFQVKGYRSVHLVGRGLGAITATFAAHLHPIVRQVTLHNALLSYHELTQAPVQSWGLSSLVFGILKDFDLPDLLRELTPRKKLTLVDPWNSQMRPWERKALRKHLKALGLKSARIRFT